MTQRENRRHIFGILPYGCLEKCNLLHRIRAEQTANIIFERALGMGNGYSASHVHLQGQLGSQSDDVLKLASHAYLFGSPRKFHVDRMRGDLEVICGPGEPAHDDFIGADFPAELQLRRPARHDRFGNAQFFVGG